MSYKQIYQYLFISFTIFYLVVSNLGYLLRFKSTREFFPFYNWFLFVTVPNPIQSDCGLIVHEFQGKKLEKPTLFKDLPEFVVNTGLKSKAKTHIRNMCDAYKNGEENRFVRLRSELENNYVKGHIAYELVSLKINLFRYQENNPITSVERIVYLESLK